MKDDEISPLRFAKERAREIQLIEAAIESNRKKSMLFQRLPFYLRRRPKSHEKRAKRNKGLRKKDRHGLRTHTWYAKRFEMLKVWGSAVPLRRRMKSSKFIYKSQHRGFVFDESYKTTVVYLRPATEVLGIDFSLENVVQQVWHKNAAFEAIVTKRYLVIISLGEEIKLDLAEHRRMDCCLSLVKIDSLIGSDACPKTLHAALDADDSIGCSEVVYVKSTSETETAKVFVKREEVMDFWQSLVNAGVIPVSVEELQRLALENDYMVYPFDFAGTRAYADFEQSYVEPARAKYERTPKSKKMEMDTRDMYIHTDERIVYALFELEKGSADRCAFVLDDDKVVGRVIRSAFCFTRGVCRGVCYLFQNAEGDEFYTRNMNSKSFNQIKILRVLDAETCPRFN